MKNTSKIITIFLAAVLCFSGCAAPDYSASKQYIPRTPDPISVFHSGILTDGTPRDICNIRNP